MKKSIITDINFIKQKSKNVEENEVQDIIKDLEDSLDIMKGCGLSAIQIGLKKKVAIIRIPFRKIFIDLINAEIVEKNEKFRFPQEGCLSIPGIRVDTTRYGEITINNNGKLQCFDLETDGIVCVAVQQEIDHLKGITILDRKWRRIR